MKALIVYCTASEKNKPSNEEKTANFLVESLLKKNIKAKKLLLEPAKNIGLKQQLKKEKEFKLKTKIPLLNEYDFVFIGTPIVGPLTSSPIINTFLRLIPKDAGKNSKPIFAIYSTGIIEGFALRKMQSLLSMKGIKVAKTQSFTSIFEFDSKKLFEVGKFLEEVLQKALN
ncbi:MAG: hypothetical protein NTY48_05370 [Candidatus Diapherotrites archaeon]|nr:hypothetical protein [Candidatus Diapherotrites archaeon]